MLRKPSLYLSDFFERNKGSYYDALTQVRISNDILHWIKFFLNAVIETADKGKATFKEILNLRQEIDSLILSYGKRAENAQKLLKKLYSKPAITINEASCLLSISHQTASSLINKMVEDNILIEATGYQRNRVFFFERYLKLFMN